MSRRNAFEYLWFRLFLDICNNVAFILHWKRGLFPWATWDIPVRLRYTSPDMKSASRMGEMYHRYNLLPIVSRDGIFDSMRPPLVNLNCGTKFKDFCIRGDTPISQRQTNASLNAFLIWKTNKMQRCRMYSPLLAEFWYILYFLC